MTIHLRLLAAPALCVDEQPPLPLPAKDALLLALLALDGPQPRDALAPLLWPDAPPAGGRANLRQRVKRLQDISTQRLLQADGSQLALSPAVAHDLQHLAPRLHADAHAATGALLGHLQLHGCPAASDWLAQARARTDAQRQQALQDHAQTLEDARQFGAALPYAQRLATEAPLQEHAWRRLMRLHYLRGDRSAALAAYRQLAQALRHDGVPAPDAQTQALARLIEGAQPAATAVPPAPVPRAITAPAAPAAPLHPAPPAAHAAAAWAALLRPPHLLQREHDWAELGRVWAQGGTAVVLGEAGIGKTRLLHDFADSTGLALRLQARPGDAAVPYALLARWVAALQPQAQALPDWARAELARLLPALGPAPPGPLVPLHLTQALALLGAPQDAVLLDDLHFADAASLELLPAVLEPVRCRLLAARSNELPAVLQAWLTASADVVTTLSLQPWHADSVQALLAQSGLPCPAQQLPAWAALLWRHTGGHPLLLLETLRAVLLAQGAAQPPASFDTVPDTLPMPAQVLRLLQARLQQLPPLALGVAQLASLAGDSFGPQATAAVWPGEPQALAQAWQALQAAALMNAQGQMHDLALQAARDTLAPPLAAHLHGRLAQHLQARNTAPARLALHWAAAGQPAEAAACHEQAAAVAAQVSRRRDEAEHHAQAGRCWAQSGAHDRAFAAWTQEANTLIVSGDVQQGLARAQTLLQTAASPLQMAQAHRALALGLTYATQWGAAASAAAEAAAAARTAADDKLLVEALLLHAYAAANLGQRDAALQCLADQEGVAVDPADWRAALTRASGAANVWLRLGRTEEALERTEQCIVLASRPEAQTEQLVLLGNSATILIKLGRLPQALERARQGHRLALKLGLRDSMQAVNLRMHAGMTAAALGQFSAAVAELETSVAEGRKLQLPRVAVIAQQHLAAVWIALGQPARALPLLQDCATGLTTSNRVRRWLLRSDLCRLCGTAPVAGEPPVPLDDTVDTAVAFSARLRMASSLPASARVAALLAVEDSCREQGEPAIALHASLLRLQAWAALEPEAAAPLALALQQELAQRMPLQAYAPEALAMLHQALLATGQPEAAQRSLAAAWQWVQSAHDAHVPDTFRDSFLRRNAVNAALQRAWQASNVQR